jgi:uncharacterized protein YndB with AHSA1/START domain
MSIDPAPSPGASDAAVEKATGRTWRDWVAKIDGWGGEALSHQEIVALLQSRGGVESGWWRQMVTNGYEKLKGRRATGETQDADFQIGVSRTLDVPPERVWAVVRSDRGLRAWLGETKGLSLRAGVRFATLDGAAGEVRVVSEKHVRLTWAPEGWPKPSTIQVRVEPKEGGRSLVSFEQEGLPGPAEREERRAHYRAALDALEEVLRD